MIIMQKKLIVFLLSLTISLRSSAEEITPNFIIGLPSEPNQLCPTPSQEEANRYAAYVRRDGGLCADEVRHIINRLPVLQTGLKKLLGYDIPAKYVPNISLVFSGGGYRAMIATTGFLLGAQDIGLLDATWYTAALSGSTWALGGWLVQNLPLRTYQAMLQDQVKTHLFATPLNLTALCDTFVQKALHGQKVTPVDIWGAFIGNMLFRNISPTGKDILLSTFTRQFAAQNAPIPLFTAVADINNKYAWFEYSPFEAGCIDSNAYIPLSTFNSPFNKGVAEKILPEQTLGYLLGVCGAAFSINCRDAIRHIKNAIAHPIILPILEDMMHFFNIGTKRLIASKNKNFMFGLNGSEFADKEELCLIDGGIAFNLPVAPLLRRGVDVYIFCDMSGGLQNHKAFKDAIDYAGAQGVKLPRIYYDNIDKQDISFFIDSDDASVPIVLYVPNMQEEKTTKFEYSSSEFNNVCGDMERRVSGNKAIIAKAVEYKIKQLAQMRGVGDEDRMANLDVNVS